MANDATPTTGKTGAWRSAAALGLIALVGTGVLALVHDLTRERIAEQERSAMRRQLDEILGGLDYDNTPYQDRVRIRGAAAFPGGQTVTAYRARRNGEPVAVVLRLAAPDGYNGPINLLVGIREDGRVTGVRVTSHNETPGLGDAVETDRSDWIEGFTGKSLSNPPPRGWAVEKDGGVFEQFTGATITPRAVVEAVQRTLEYFSANRDTLFARPAEPALPPSPPLDPVPAPGT